ncbi:MAG: hypothetical protein L0Z62_00115 [Gemmataceae bacterium]|nr:hypothetical protein [Gemmataceae bacterium]
MGKKPVLGLVGAFLAGATLIGCRSGNSNPSTFSPSGTTPGFSQRGPAGQGGVNYARPGQSSPGTIDYTQRPGVTPAGGSPGLSSQRTPAAGSYNLRSGSSGSGLGNPAPSTNFGSMGTPPSYPGTGGGMSSPGMGSVGGSSSAAPRSGVADPYPPTGSQMSGTSRLGSDLAPAPPASSSMPSTQTNVYPPPGGSSGLPPMPAPTGTAPAVGGPTLR